MNLKPKFIAVNALGHVVTPNLLMFRIPLTGPGFLTDLRKPQQTIGLQDAG